jgi:YD repeat-containing protein
MTYATNPLNQTRFWEYDSAGRITRITTPVAVAYGDVAYGTTNTTAPTAQSYNYSSPCSGVTAPANTNLPISVTDSEGYTLCYQYDPLDRVTVVKYPDGTTDQYDYTFPNTWPIVSSRGTQSLDVWKVTDRLGRIVNYSYDQNRRLTGKSETVKVAGVDVVRTTSYSYYANGVLKELTDANGAVTHWDVDIQSRPVSKTYAYGTANAKTESYSYDLAGRLKTRTDARGQTVTYTWNKDNSLASYAFTNAVVATAGASFSYDPWYPRRTSMTDQYGTTTWTYRAVLTNGALLPDTEDGPFASNDTITYTYDAAGRVATRKIDAANESLTYDVLGRLQSLYIQELATFAYTWLGNSGQIASRQAIGSVSFTTSYGYDTNANDRRLLTITNTGSAARNYSYTSNPYQITGISETMPPGHPWVSQTRTYGYDASDRLLTATASTAGNKSYGYDKLDNATSFAGVTGTYNSLNQINSFNGTSYVYDANGNLVLREVEFAGDDDANSNDGSMNEDGDDMDDDANLNGNSNFNGDDDEDDNRNSNVNQNSNDNDDYDDDDGGDDDHNGNQNSNDDDDQGDDDNNDNEDQDDDDSNDNDDHDDDDSNDNED